MIFYFLENNAQLESVSVEAFKEKPQKSMLFQNMLLSHNKYGTLFNGLTIDSIANNLKSVSKKTVTIHSSHTVLWVVTVFLKQTLVIDV